MLVTFGFTSDRLMWMMEANRLEYDEYCTILSKILGVITISHCFTLTNHLTLVSRFNRFRYVNHRQANQPVNYPTEHCAKCPAGETLTIRTSPHSSCGLPPSPLPTINGAVRCTKVLEALPKAWYVPGMTRVAKIPARAILVARSCVMVNWLV